MLFSQVVATRDKYMAIRDQIIPDSKKTLVNM